jgi:hypothetical protein
MPTKPKKGPTFYGPFQPSTLYDGLTGSVGTSNVNQYYEQSGHYGGLMGNLGMGSSQPQAPNTYRPPTKAELDRWRADMRNEGEGSGTLISPADALGNIAESMLPYLGEGENINLASWLKYNQGKETPSPGAWAGNLFTQQRAEQAAEAIRKAATSQNMTAEQLGPGFTFLMDTIDLLKRYAGEDGMSRANYAKMMTEYNAMNSSGEFGAYSTLAQSFIAPRPGEGENEYFPRFRLGSQNVYGRANKKLFR